MRTSAIRPASTRAAPAKQIFEIACARRVPTLRKYCFHPACRPRQHESAESVPPPANSFSCTRCETTHTAPTAPRRRNNFNFRVIYDQRRRRIRGRRSVRDISAQRPAILRRHAARLSSGAAQQRKFARQNLVSAALQRRSSKRPASRAPTSTTIPRNSPRFQIFRNFLCGNFPASSKTIRSVPPANGFHTPGSLASAPAPPQDPAAFPFRTPAGTLSRAGLRPPHRRHHRFENLHVPRAAAQIPGEPFANLRVVRLADAAPANSPPPESFPACRFRTAPRHAR